MKTRIIKIFCVFLLFVALAGAGISLVNHQLRVHGMNSTATTALLLAIIVFVYYKAWKVFCRKLDNSGKE